MPLLTFSSAFAFFAITFKNHCVMVHKMVRNVRMGQVKHMYSLVWVLKEKQMLVVNRFICCRVYLPMY